MRISTLILVSFIFSGSLSAESHNNNPAENAKDCVTHTVTNETKNVTHIITRCSDKASSNLPNNKPAEKTADKDGENKPEWHWQPFNLFSDLAAQISMAESTYWIKWASIVGTIVSIIGIRLLFYTIRQNSETFSHIRKTSIAEFRPYLELKHKHSNLSAIGPDNEGHTFMLSYTLDITNVGKTPAKKITSIEPISGTLRGKFPDSVNHCDPPFHAIEHLDGVGEMLFGIKPHDPTDNNVWMEYGAGGMHEYVGPGVEKTHHSFVFIDPKGEGVLLSYLCAKTAGYTCTFEFRALMRFKDEYGLKNGEHFVVEFSATGDHNGIKSIQIESESLISDGEHYEKHERVKTY